VIDRATVHHVARLARLRLDEGEEERMQQELAAILGAVEQLQDLDLSGVEPTSHVVALTNVLRDDVPGESLPQEVALREGPDVQDDGFVVPKIG
jgi:aspartyl-tRNA(Asn)/glutamyl-tRNA(Gln) amidotransferase subunit C